MNEEDRSAPTRIMTAAEVADAELGVSRTATTDRLPASPTRAIIDSLPTPTPTQMPIPIPIPGPCVVAPDPRRSLRRGWATSEHWLVVAAILLSAAYANGVIASDRMTAIAGIAATALGVLGYTASRTALKAKA